MWTRDLPLFQDPDKEKLEIVSRQNLQNSLFIENAAENSLILILSVQSCLIINGFQKGWDLHVVLFVLLKYRADEFLKYGMNILKMEKWKQEECSNLVLSVFFVNSSKTYFISIYREIIADSLTREFPDKCKAAEEYFEKHPMRKNQY